MSKIFLFTPADSYLVLYGDEGLKEMLKNKGILPDISMVLEFSVKKITDTRFALGVSGQEFLIPYTFIGDMHH